MPTSRGRGGGGRGRGGGGVTYLDAYPAIGELEAEQTYYVYETEEWLTLDERTIAGTPAVAAVAQGMGAITRTEVDATFFATGHYWRNPRSGDFDNPFNIQPRPVFFYRTDLHEIRAYISSNPQDSIISDFQTAFTLGVAPLVRWIGHSTASTLAGWVMGTQGITTMAGVIAWFDGDGVFDPALRYFFYDEDRNRVYEIDTYVAGTPGSPAIPEGPSRDETYIRTLDDRLEFDSQDDFPHPSEARLNTIYYDQQERSSYLVELEDGYPRSLALTRRAVRNSTRFGPYQGATTVIAAPVQGWVYILDGDDTRIVPSTFGPGYTGVLGVALISVLDLDSSHTVYWLGNSNVARFNRLDSAVGGSGAVDTLAEAAAFIDENNLSLTTNDPTLYFDADDEVIYIVDELLVTEAFAGNAKYKLHAISPRIEVALPALARVPSADGAVTGLDVLLASQDIPASLTSRAITNDDLAEVGGTATDWGGIMAADPAQPGAGENGILYYNSASERLRWSNPTNGWRNVVHNRGAFIQTLGWLWVPEDRFAAASGRFADNAAALQYILDNLDDFRNDLRAGFTHFAFVDTTSNEVRVGRYEREIDQSEHAGLANGAAGNRWELHGEQRDLGTPATSTALSNERETNNTDIDSGNRAPVEWASPIVQDDFPGFPAQGTLAFYHNGPVNLFNGTIYANAGSQWQAVTQDAYVSVGGARVSFFNPDIVWAYNFPSSFASTLTNPGRFASADEVVAYVDANPQYFTNKVVNEGVTKIAWFDTTTETVRVADLALGNAAVDPEPLELVVDEAAETLTLRHAPAAGVLVAAPDTLGDVHALFDAHTGTRALYYGAADADTPFTLPVPWQRDFAAGADFTLLLSGYALGPPTNTFTGDTRAAAQDARDAYGTANPNWLGIYAADIRLFIVLRWGDAGDAVSQALGSDGNWHDTSFAFVGQPGRDGRDANLGASQEARRGAEAARAAAESARDDSQEARDDSQTARDAAQSARDESQSARDESRQARDDIGDGVSQARAARDASRAASDDSEGYRDEAERARDLSLQSIGGGSVISIGTFETDAARPAWQLIATGLFVPDDTVWLLWRLNINAGALWIYVPAIADAPVAEDGDSISADQRAVLPESAGQSIGGAPYGRFTADRELLVATSGSNEDLSFDLLRYVPADQVPSGGGLSAADQAKLDGIENAATADQTGAEIKTLYEAEDDTNAFTDAEKAQLVAAAAANWVESVTGSGSTITITRRDGTVTEHTFPMGGMGGVSDGVLDEAPVFDEAAQTVTFHISTGATFTLNLSDLVTQTELDAAINGLANQTNAEVKASYEANPDTNAYSNGEKTKLAGIFNGANLIAPYKLGNIYIATAGTEPTKPGNTEGTATIAGITDAPAGWRLTRPEPTAALPWVFDCHVYGYVTNSVFGVQYGTPNRTDRYIAPSDFDLHDDVTDEIGGVSSSDRLLISDEGTADDPNRYVTVTNLRNALVTAATIRSRLGLTEAEVANMLVGAVVVGNTLTLTMNDGSTVDFVRAAAGAGIDMATANGLIQAALAAAVSGNTETGIAVTYNDDGTLDFVVAGGGGTPMFTDDLYLGTSADDTPEAAELTIPAVNGVGTIPAYAGHRHHIIARLATEGDITGVFYSDDPSMDNALGAFTKQAATLVPPGESLAYSIWITNQALTNTADVVVTVR